MDSRFSLCCFLAWRLRRAPPRCDFFLEKGRRLQRPLLGRTIYRCRCPRHRHFDRSDAAFSCARLLSAASRSGEISPPPLHLQSSFRLRAPLLLSPPPRRQPAPTSTAQKNSAVCLSRTPRHSLPKENSSRRPTWPAASGIPALPGAAAHTPADGHAHGSTHVRSNGRHADARCRCHSPTRAAAVAPDYR